MDAFKYVMMSSVQRLSRDPLLVRIPRRRWRIHQEGSGVQRWEGGSRHWALSSQLLPGVTGAWLRGATLGADVAIAPQLCSPSGQRAEVAVHQVPPVIARGLFLRGLRAGSGRESLRQRPAGAGSGAGVRWSGRWETGRTPNFIHPASPVSDTDNHIFPVLHKVLPQSSCRTSPLLSSQPCCLTLCPLPYTNSGTVADPPGITEACSKVRLPWSQVELEVRRARK